MCLENSTFIRSTSVFFSPFNSYLFRLLHLVAEDMAIEDVQYELNRALFNGQIDLATHVKLTRTLSREQFFKRALIKKIHAVEAGAPIGHM